MHLVHETARMLAASQKADGYPGFNKLYERGRIVEAACWAHVRRKFHDLYQAHRSPIAKETLERIGQLNAIEHEIRGRSPAERKQVRETRSRPLLESIQSETTAYFQDYSRSPKPMGQVTDFSPFPSIEARPLERL